MSMWLTFGRWRRCKLPSADLWIASRRKSPLPSVLVSVYTFVSIRKSSMSSFDSPMSCSDRPGLKGGYRAPVSKRCTPLSWRVSNKGSIEALLWNSVMSIPKVAVPKMSWGAISSTTLWGVLSCRHARLRGMIIRENTFCNWDVKGRCFYNKLCSRGAGSAPRV